jgi:hypothetical protein
MSAGNLTRLVLPAWIGNAVAAGDADTQYSSGVLVGPESDIGLAVAFGAIVSGGNGVVSVQGSNDNGVDDAFVSVGGSGIPYTSAQADKLEFIVIQRPFPKTYLRLAVTRLTDNVAIQGFLALRHPGPFQALTQDSSVHTVKFLRGPGLGSP